MSAQFFYSWSKQENPSTIDIISTTTDSYFCKDTTEEVYDLSSCSYQLSFGLRNEQITDAISQQCEVLPAAGPKANQ